MNRSWLMVLMLTLAAADASAQAEPPIGRLFHTPQERQALDRLRQIGAADSLPGRTDTLTYDGVVRRSDGEVTTWINGQINHGVALQTRPGSSAATIRSDRGDSRLQVGDSFDLESGATEDLLRGGQISTRRR